MKGLILAGGTGTRLRPITHARAKQLVPVANKPIIFYGLEDLAAAGVTDVGVVVGSTAEEIEAELGDGSAFGLRLTYIPQAEPLGLAHCVLIARDFLGDDDFVMYLGDNLVRHGVAEFVARFEEQRREGGPEACAARILLARVPDPQRFGVASFAVDGTVDGLVEKPADPPSELALVGVYIFDRHIHDAVRAIEPSGRGELEITDAIGWLIDNGHRVIHDELDGWWKDTGMLEPLLEGNRLVLADIDRNVEGNVEASSTIEGPVRVGPGSTITGSTITGPVVIGSGTTIVGSRIGPHCSIGDGCKIIDSVIEDSIILADSHVEGVRWLTGSLIGQAATVIRAPEESDGTRLMIGDNSRVELKA